MEGTSTFQFPGNHLDPTAQEFIPVNVINPTSIPFHHVTPTQLFFPYNQPPALQQNDAVQFVPFYNFTPQFPSAPAPQFQPQPYIGSASSAPTRALALSLVPCHVSESMLRRDLEVFGDVRGVEMERVQEGIVTVHFYDIRDTEAALREIREQHMQQQQQARHFYTSACASPARGLVSGKAVWAQFVVPSATAVPEGSNQGTLVVFNLDPNVSSMELKNVFQAFGAVKEMRETPYKKHQRFVEFFDVRDASKALKDMNGKEIHGKQVVIEFSRPGGLFNKKKFFNLLPPPPPPPPPAQPRTLLQNFPVRSVMPTKKKKPMVVSCRRGNPNGTAVAVESSMCSLSIHDGNVINGGPRKGRSSYHPAAKQQCRSSSSSSSSGKLPWKNKHSKKMDARFLISEEAMADSGGCRDSRTTLMIKNIPNKYSQKLLLNMLDNHCIHCNEQIAAQGDESQPLSSYDFLYLPIDFNNKCNVGYGFVNMTSPEAAWRLYKAFHLQNWEVFNSRKICQVTYARVQGLEALKEHFKSSKFPGEMENYLPVVFSPPRDGRQLTEPVPIVDINPTKVNGSNTNETNGDRETDGPDGPDDSTCSSCDYANDVCENVLLCSCSSSLSLDGGESGVDRDLERGVLLD